MSRIQEPWASALLAKEFVDSRYEGEPSWRALSRAIKVSVTTLTKMASGARSTSQATVDKVADALGVDRKTVSSWVGRTRPTSGTYTLPDAASLLDPDEQEAITRLILLLTRERMGKGHGKPAEKRSKVGHAAEEATPAGIGLKQPAPEVPPLPTPGRPRVR